MKLSKSVLLILLLSFLCGSCNSFWPDQEPEEIDLVPMGTLDMAFVYRIQGVPRNRIKKVELSLALSADEMYRKEFFTTTNVSDAVTHYSFYLAPGEYYYNAIIVCLCGGDSCKYAGFMGENNLMEAGGKVVVLDGQVTHYTTQFH